MISPRVSPDGCTRLAVTSRLGSVRPPGVERGEQKPAPMTLSRRPRTPCLGAVRCVGADAGLAVRPAQSAGNCRRQSSHAALVVSNSSSPGRNESPRRSARGCGLSTLLLRDDLLSRRQFVCSSVRVPRRGSRKTASRMLPLNHNQPRCRCSLSRQLAHHARSHYNDRHRLSAGHRDCRSLCDAPFNTASVSYHCSFRNRHACAVCSSVGERRFSGKSPQRRVGFYYNSCNPITISSLFRRKVFSGNGSYKRGGI